MFFQEHWKVLCGTDNGFFYGIAVKLSFGVFIFKSVSSTYHGLGLCSMLVYTYQISVILLSILGITKEH